VNAANGSVTAETKPLPTWDEMSDLDKGAAISYIYRLETVGEGDAEHYPAEYFDDPRLVALGAGREASTHAEAVAEEGFGDLAEVRRLHTLGLAAEAERSSARFVAREEAVQAALDALAPWPKREEDVTADALARHLAVSAQARIGQIDDLMQDGSEAGKRLYMTTIGLFVNEYGMVRALRALIDVFVDAPVHADKVAQDLWRDWQDGGSIGEWLWHWLSEDYGIDPDEVTAAARQSRDEAKTTPKEPTHA